MNVNHGRNYRKKYKIQQDIGNKRPLNRCVSANNRNLCGTVEFNMLKARFLT